ncbi:MAG: metallopeptidase TldD-related protein [Bryobacterales bacterium]|nr:metallopeptidase TldD-related protein [Bryobacteraceae bacterium]MDW8353053.1 metallopeptidase TldD-related protein [Bryobacterales bacterium]
MRRLLWAAAFALAGFASAQTPTLLDILTAELDRNFHALKEKGDPPPYFLAYAVWDTETHLLSASLGVLEARSANRSRVLDVTVRVGTPQLDNYRRLAGDRPRFAGAVALPLDDIPAPIKRIAWLETDRIYREAVQRLIRVRTSAQVKPAEEDPSPDFSSERPEQYLEAPSPLRFSPELFEDRIRRWSAALSRPRHVLASNVTFWAQQETKYFTSSEGSRLQHNRALARIVLSARGRAADGMELTIGETFEAETPERLPGDKIVLQAIERLTRNLAALEKAPEAEPFAGPAILSGRAAGVFFHEIFGHRIEGHRQKDETEGQTFAKSLGLQVLPPFLSVIYDPTRRSLNGVDLNGYYLYDDEGVKARPVVVVENGILKTFLMSRSPVRGVERSNGHGRRQPGFEVVSRQSNLIVESSRRVPESRLRQMLLEEIRRQNKPYGLFFEEVTGGFTQTGRRGVQAFAVIPILVYRVYPDGRQELVRGADIVGTPLASFSNIVATGDKLEVFNGFCGAESGSIPVASVAPALLVSEIEIQKREKSQDRPPLLPRPDLTPLETP